MHVPCKQALTHGHPAPDHLYSSAGAADAADPDLAEFEAEIHAIEAVEDGEAHARSCSATSPPRLARGGLATTLPIPL